MITRTVEIDVFEGTTDDEFEDVLSMVRITHHVCDAREVDIVKSVPKKEWVK